MKYLNQVLWILLFTFAGEALHAVIDLPIPASIYGLVLFLVALLFKLVKLEWVKETSHFLVSILSLLFICPAVGLMNTWPIVQANWLPICVIVTVSLLLTFFVSGIVTKLLMGKDGNHE